MGIMTRTVKPEFQEGGSRRQEILDKAVEYILDPKFGTQKVTETNVTLF